MVVVMAPEATEEDVTHVVEKVTSVGGEAFVSKGVTRTIIGLVGDIDSFHGLNLRTLQPFIVWTAVGILYYLAAKLVALLGGRLEKRLRAYSAFRGL